ncbi:hypothetical protein EDB81DRAFT_436897 [Dactylonectria macrodidyma]|uniref:Ubiquitin-like domain-containing protein n=1 Tax=Dactylonectria macrodidyma TaxID=307937 RepID=A0A9P9F3D9_9HYPO|nr:hypothetical protein EDB81DRAFT_436897 [Dactylonectria macrodidyma]
MASEPASSRSDNSSPGSPDQLTVNLQVVSPSVGVNRPLMFPGLAATTTVKELKQKIRETLPLRPADENQRLIHRGRAIVRETDTLLTIFGVEVLRTPDQQTIHLVIRDTHDSHPAPQAAAPAPNPTVPVQPANVPHQHAHHHHPFANFATGMQQTPGLRRVQLPTAGTNPFTIPRVPSPSPHHTPEQAAAFQHQHQNMTQWLNHIQREAMARAVAQNQRQRAQMGMRGVGDTAGYAVHNGGDNTGRASPASSHNPFREHVGPNAHTHQFETATRGTPPTTSNGMTPAEVQGILRGADANQATLAMTTAMQRSTSNNSIQNRSFAQPGVTTSIHTGPSSTVASRGTTPDPALARQAGAASNDTARQGPQVYILSSPDGPRALLFNNSGSDTYYTPRLRAQPSFPQLRHSHPSALGNLIYETQGQIRSRQHHHHHHHHHRAPPRQAQQQQAQVQHQVQPQPQPPYQPLQQNPPQPPQPEQILPDQANNEVQLQAQNQPIAPLMHHGNPPVAAIPPLLMQLWPQIWLLFRLALFVWFFTNPNASWSRWFTIICIAFFIFILSTGVLNGIPEHIWRPLGRHLENLIPMDPRAAQRAGQHQENGGQRENGRPDPADMAARLIAENRGPDGWLMAQIRRLERAGLLFLASIAPGVAERHIANLEATARAERQRREAEAAAAQANAENGGENNQSGENGDNEEEQNDGQDVQDQPQPQPGQMGQDNNVADVPAREQLIAV